MYVFHNLNCIHFSEKTANQILEITRKVLKFKSKMSNHDKKKVLTSIRPNPTRKRLYG